MLLSISNSWTLIIKHACVVFHSKLIYTPLFNEVCDCECDHGIMVKGNIVASYSKTLFNLARMSADLVRMLPICSFESGDVVNPATNDQLIECILYLDQCSNFLTNLFHPHSLFAMPTNDIIVAI